MNTNVTLQKFEKLIEIIDTLRKECPWDKEQTFESLRRLTIEEVYELSHAILERDYENLKEELGDLIMHVVFYATIAKEQNLFDLANIIEAINNKLIRRHPHVFGEIHVNGQKDVLENWEKIKISEGKKSVLQGIPSSLPPTIKAYRIQEKVAAVGFDWENAEDVFSKIEEEIKELKATFKDSNKEKIRAELGDVFFSLINLARHLSLDPDDCIEQTNKKFIHRFSTLEKAFTEKGKNIQEANLEEMDRIWNEIKSDEK
ncbi:MAG: nucleoside triphosphate pyrophosphohydrolase [Bacteroidales bacterium]|nr:nucleoside triphosphate pyrophosphohydrolase [Bacteroidales bacterium]